MSYTIYYSDPSKFNFPIVVQDNTKYNSVGTGGLTLVGRDYPGYGQAVAENFIHLLENSASVVPPVNPIEGQLWFDTSDPSNKKLRVNDGAANNTSWRPINGLHQTPTEPSQVALGDIWVDTTDNQLKIYNGTDFITVGPNSIGTNFTGAIADTVPAEDSNSYEVILNYVEGRVVSIISNSRFTPNPVISGFTNVEVGVTLSNDDFGTITTPRYAKFYGTAKTADGLVLTTGEVIPASTVLRNNLDQTITGQFRINKSTGALAIGTSPTFLLGTNSTGIDANFSNEVADSTFTFNVKNSVGLSVPVLVMGGANRQVNVKSTVNATNTSTGALQVAGGVAVARDVHIGGALYTDQLYADGEFGNNGQILRSNGTKMLWSDFNTGTFFTGGTSFGDISIESATSSTSSVTGALRVVGGVGIGGQVNIGSTTAASSTTGALRVAGGVSIGGGLYVGGEIIADKLTIQLTTVTTTLVTTDDIIKTTNTTTSASTVSGALQIAGGAGIGGDLYVGESLFVLGSISLSKGMNIAGVLFARSIVGNISSSTNIIDGAQGEIPIQTAPGKTSFIPAGTAGQFLRSGGTTAAFVNTSTMYVDSAVQAERLRTARTITFTGDVTGSFSLDGTQNTGTALTIQPNSIALGVDTIGDYISTGTASGYGINGSITGEGTTFNINSNATSTNNVSTTVFRDNTGSFYGNNITAVQFNGNAQGLTNIPGVQIDDGSIRNRALTSSTISIGAGSAIGVSRTTISLGDAFTITNLGVQTLSGTAYLGVSNSTGTITLTNLGVQSVSVVGALGIDTSTGTVTITDLGVQSVVGSAYLAIDQSTGTVTITNNGVRTLTGSAYLAVSTSTGTVTISNNGVQTLTGTTALGVSASTGTITLTNLGVISAAGTTYLGVSASTGSVTFTNLGVQTLTGSAYLAVNQSTGTVTITNNGVQTLTGSAYMAVSTSTGTVTITNNGVQTLTGSAYMAVSTSTGTVTITNNGVQTLTAGTDTSVSASTGTVTVWNNSTLQTITTRGSASSNAIQITNTTSASSTSTGSLVVSGGVGIGGNLYVGGEIVANKLTIQYTTVTTTLIQTDDVIQTLNTTASTSTSTGALVVSGGAGIGGNLYAGGNLNISGASTVTGTATFLSTVYASGNVGIQGNFNTTGTSILSGAVTADSTLGVRGNFNTTGTSILSGAVTADSTLGVRGNFNVTGTTTLSSGLTVSGLITASSSLDTFTSPSIATDAVTLNFANGNVFSLSSSTSNITANYTNVPTTAGQTIATTLIITQGSTAYIPSTATINTVVQTIKWQGGSAPTGNANKTDIVSFTFICNGTTTPTVVGSLTTYG